MKRVKIMLMAICLVAVAGGVLAFKTLTPQSLCTIASSDGTCTRLCTAAPVNLATEADVEAPFFCATTALIDPAVPNARTCIYTIDPEGPQTTTTIRANCNLRVTEAEEQ